MLRLDKYLVEKGFFESRNRALDAIKRGKVFVNGTQEKASFKCDDSTQVDLEQEKFYVSRAAKKLELFLEEYKMDLQGKTALDIGSSTGGFVQILLEHDVSSVACVDVGSKQLHDSLRAHEKIKVFEKTDIRVFEPNVTFDLLTCDVSFISILKIIDAIDRLALADMILLFKPQFEVGRAVKRDSRGVVVSLDAISKAKENFEEKTRELGWEMCYTTTSKIIGKSGNIEYIYHFRK